MTEPSRFGSVSEELEACESERKSQSKMTDLGFASEQTKAMSLTGVQLDGVVIPNGPLYRIWT